MLVELERIILPQSCPMAIISLVSSRQAEGEIRNQEAEVAVSTVCRFETRFRYRAIGPESPLSDVPEQPRLFHRTMPPTPFGIKDAWTGLFGITCSRSVESESCHPCPYLRQKLGAAFQSNRRGIASQWLVDAVGSEQRFTLSRAPWTVVPIKRHARTFCSSSPC